MSQDLPAESPAEVSADVSAEVSPNAAPGFDAASLLATLPELPGVYRMLDAAGQVLYVGKAKSLKKRVASYFREHHPSPRIGLMVRQIARVDITVTQSETEALLLENNLIKELKPRYNILFRDDKSYPYIVITRATSETAPRLGFHRGKLDRRDDFFGPFPASSAVRESIHLLQKMFRLRTCEDAVYLHRTRPCLLYQIRRCSGPCVDAISREDYAADVGRAALFLQGKQQELIAQLNVAMEAAAAALAFEQAAQIRDQIQSLRHVQEKQCIESAGEEDLDIVVVVRAEGLSCVNLAMIRGGRHLGDRPLFPGNVGDAGPGDVLAAFLQQHYLAHPLPPRIVVNLLPEEDPVPALQELAGHPLHLGLPRQSLPRRWVDMACDNARLAIIARRQTQARQGQRLQALAQALQTDGVANDTSGGEVSGLQRIECFDISHTQGEATVASCVVYQGDGMLRADYRRYNISDITPGDDYAAMHQVLTRRYGKLVDTRPDQLQAEEIETMATESTALRPVPDLILIDGGKGQVAAAWQALAAIGAANWLGPRLLGVAKGEGRRPGLETLIFADGREPLQLPPEHPALHLIQEIRDEAHRFAITGHRAKRGKARRVSSLEGIAGVGPRRRKALIAHFGGLQGVAAASVDQLATVSGISHELAVSIHAALH